MSLHREVGEIVDMVVGGWPAHFAKTGDKQQFLLDNSNDYDSSCSCLQQSAKLIGPGVEDCIAPARPRCAAGGNNDVTVQLNNLGRHF
jgi:hypothetical protein